MSLSGLAYALTLTVGPVAVPLAAEAQPSGKVPRIGALVVASPGFAPVEGFRQGLRDLGYAEDRNLAVEYRYAEGKANRYGALAAEVVRGEVSVSHPARSRMHGSRSW